MIKTKLQYSDFIVTGSSLLIELEMIASVLFKKLDNDVLIMGLVSLEIGCTLITVPLFSDLFACQTKYACRHKSTGSGNFLGIG